MNVLVWCTFLGGLAGLGVWGVPRVLPLLRSEGKQPAPAGTAHTSAEYNYRFVLPGRPWERDDATRVAVKAEAFAMRRTAPDAWLALGVKDYKTRMPRDAEVVQEVVRRLEGYFKQFEWEPKGEGQLGGRRAQRLVFQGAANDVMMSGECYALVYQGIAYWFLTWSSAADVESAAGEFQELRQRFALLREREGWKPAPLPVQTFRGRQAAYTLRDDEGLWRKWEEAKDKDEKADLALLGKDRDEPLDVDKNAWVLALLLDKPANDLAGAMKAAEAYLREQQRKRGFDKTEITPLPGEEAREEPVGEARAQVAKLHVKNGETQNLFVLLAVVPRPEHVLVIQCECDLRRRNVWEREFVQLLNTFSLSSK